MGRRPSILAVAFLALAGLSLGLRPAAVQARGPALAAHAGGLPRAGRPRYSTHGLWIVDAQGRRLILRGLDVSGAEFTPTADPLPYGPTSFEAIRAAGATVVRVPIAWALIEPNDGRYDPAALARIDQIVAWAGQAGLRVILDMHQWHWSRCFGGNGIPAWATNPCPDDISASDANTPLESAAETAFWSSQPLQARFAAAWVTVLESLKASNDGVIPGCVLGYDLFNEPPGGYVPPGVFDNVVLPAFYRQVTTAIRGVDPGALVFVEPPLLTDPARTTMSTLGIPRAVYSPHLYGDSLNDASGDAADLLGPAQFTPDLVLGEQDAKRLHAAFWPGEWGDLNSSSSTSYDEDGYAADMISAQDQALVGSAYWTYWSSGTWPWTPDIQTILTRPSPFAIAGRLISFTTSESTLRLTWSSDGRSTLVSVPAGWTPLVQVLTGSAHWDTPSPGWVAIRAPAGSRVTVEVRSR